MRLIKASFNTSVYTENEDVSINEMIEPRLYNSGESDIDMNGIIIKPESSFSFGVQGAKMNGNFSLKFIEEAGKRNEARLFYCSEIEENRVCD